MSTDRAVVNGQLMYLEEATVPATDPAVTLGWSVFETMVAGGEHGDLLPLHLDRLEASAIGGHVPFPGRDVLTAEIRQAVAAFGSRCRVRITLTGGGNRVIAATALDPSRRHRAVQAVRGRHRDEPYLGGSIKHGSRLPWVIAVARSGADEVLLVDEDGRFTEGTTCAILAVMDGVIHAAPDDGRVLPSTTLRSLLLRARDLGVDVIREGPPAAGPWDGLYVASATRDIAPVVALDGQPLAGWEDVGRALAASWSEGG